MVYTITEFMGDGISGELSKSIRVLIDKLPIDIDLIRIDMSLEARTVNAQAVYDKAYESISETKFAIKYPTVTENESPNAVMRRRCGFSVIHRPVFTLPGVKSHFKANVDLDIIRVATGGTYEDPGKMIGRDAAVSIRMVERKPCEEAARFAFQLAKKLKKPLCSSSKYTIQAVTDGLFQSVVNEVALKYPEVPHTKELFDALLAKVIMYPENYGVIVVLNEYGDFLSDLACGLVGSIGIGGSGSFAFDDSGDVTLAMFDPSGGTAPDIAGKNIANPTAIIIAFTLLLQELGELKLSSALHQAIVNLLKQGISTRDLGGNLNTDEFTIEVANETLTLLDKTN